MITKEHIIRKIFSNEINGSKLHNEFIETRNKQFGGGNLIIKYEGKEYKFEKIAESDGFYVLFIDDTDKECVSIKIDRNRHLAGILVSSNIS